MKKRGRPPIDNPKNVAVHIRLSTSEKEELDRYKLLNGMTCGDILKLGMDYLKKLNESKEIDIHD